MAAARPRGRAAVLLPVVAAARSQGPARDVEARLAEACGLARAIGLEIVHAEAVRVTRRRPATLIGKGAIERFAALVVAEQAELVIFDAALSPIQQRNLERALDCKVIDRTALILEIFGARARTREGRLQVELAHLTWQRSRLVRSWTHLERQRGGFGFLGGPGESQLEIDRRLIGRRIIRIRRDLEAVRKRRALHRKARKRTPHPIAALVGYTNAGKSTLFNRLTQAKVVAEDRLFATLDPTMRAVRLPSGRKLILSDTVGFIADLPTELVAAFRATLEEVLEADVVVHVRDISHPETETQKADVLAVLDRLGLGRDDGCDDQIVEALNKIDRLSETNSAALARRVARSNPPVVMLSALTGAGCGDLLALLDARLGEGRAVHDYDIALADGAAIAWLYARGDVLSREDDETRAHLRVSLDAADAARFAKRRRAHAG